MKILKNNYRELALTILLASLVVLTRTVFHIGDNVEFVTATGLISGYFFKNKLLSFAPLFVGLALSDLLLGNTIIFLFTWSGFLFVPALGITLANFKRLKTAELLLGAQVSGILSTIFFFAWTNFGVVLTTNMYEKSLVGLFKSYINALPFLENQLAGNILIVPALFLVALTVQMLFNSRTAMTSQLSHFGK